MIILALGSNLDGVFGTPYQSISRALNELTASGIKIKDASRLYRTRAYSRHPQPDFLNAIAMAHTPLPAHTLLEILKRIEAQAGRRELTEAHQWKPRPLDLDIVSYKGVIHNWKMQKPLEG
ncbi:MAG: 2-amino-4-hydroxy-6-hydroxymethyldihydropteridine diphosphokinase, partial [Rhodomicrobium sp.]